MKTLKYRSAFASIAVAALSVFLFTACEKDTDSPVQEKESDRLAKFSRLVFSGATSATESGGGTFSGGGGSINFSAAGGGGATFAEAGGEAQVFASIEGNGQVFTDPMSTGPVFGISGLLGTGGGSFTVNGETEDLIFGYCASQPVGGNTSLPDSTSDVKVFVGIAGDWLNESNDLTFIYVISYNNSTKIGSFYDYNDWIIGTPLDAYVVVVRFEEDEMGQSQQYTYFGTEGNISFGSSSVSISNATLVKIENDDLTQDEVDFSAEFDCIEYNEPED
tara:strand:- start:484 stop:1314 length:831 start_codon:yes stop_codon:yes gene_type:complete